MTPPPRASGWGTLSSQFAARRSVMSVWRIAEALSHFSTLPEPAWSRRRYARCWRTWVSSERFRLQTAAGPSRAFGTPKSIMRQRGGRSAVRLKAWETPGGRTTRVPGSTRASPLANVCWPRPLR